MFKATPSDWISGGLEGKKLPLKKAPLKKSREKKKRREFLTNGIIIVEFFPPSFLPKDEVIFF